jgi:hypothetical protein
MSIVVQIAITLVSWLAIMFVSTNLTGLLIRSFIVNRELNEIASSNEILTHDLQKSQGVARIISTVLIVAFLGILYYFWNMGLMAAGLMLILSRAPDQIWEMKSERKLEMGDMSKPQFSVLTTLLSWASLPVVWYSIYQL